MSIHKSLKQKSTLVRARSVLTRWERILKLKDQGRWKDGDPVVGLPKVRTKWKVRKRKKEAVPVAGAAVPGAAAPAAGAPGAAPAAAGTATAAKTGAGAKASASPGAGQKPAAAEKIKKK